MAPISQELQPWRPPACFIASTEPRQAVGFQGWLSCCSVAARLWAFLGLQWCWKQSGSVTVAHLRCAEGCTGFVNPQEAVPHLMSGA